MEVGLQHHIRTVHGYCLFLRSCGSDQMSRANVHSVHQYTGRAAFSGCSGGAGALIRLSIRKGENSRRFPATSPVVTTTAATTSSNSVVLFCRSSHPSLNAELTPRSPEREPGRSSAQWQGFRAIGWRFGVSEDTITLVRGSIRDRCVAGSG